jgi:hypothetical protein
VHMLEKSLPRFAVVAAKQYNRKLVSFVKCLVKRKISYNNPRQYPTCPIKLWTVYSELLYNVSFKPRLLVT